MKIEMKNISKSFGNNRVLESIDLVLNSGEVHALMGGEWRRQINLNEYFNWTFSSYFRNYFY